MSQQLIAIDGGVQEIQTATLSRRVNVLSNQYLNAKNLNTRPTEWVIGGRPIYRRLPAVSETYQIDFFNIIAEQGYNSLDGVQDIGYVYVPWGESNEGPISLYVSASDTQKDLIIRSGVIAWKYGTTNILPAIVNLDVLDPAPGQYDIAYQLLFDDAPVQKLYQVENFYLTGLPLTITSSTDTVTGWRYSAVNAFLDTTTRFWRNQDTYFPTYIQPASSFLQWESDLAMAYSEITLRCPSGSSVTGTATLTYYDGVSYYSSTTVAVESDDNGQFFKFVLEPQFETGWKIEFSSLNVSIQTITVSGVITLIRNQASPSTRAVLVMYPSGTLPKTTINSSGETIPATYCPLAIVDIDKSLKINSLQDLRYIIHKDYTPIADWLTHPFDSDLINLYEQVSDYPLFWMSPESCMKQEYVALKNDQITVIQ